jgi:hypothetical protein
MPLEPALVETTVLRLLAERGAGKTISPAEAATALTVGPDWHLAMAPVRRAAIKLALTGQIVIYRKGKPVDPNDFKGVYRLGLPRHD